VELQLGLFRGEIAIDVPTNRSRLSVNVEFTVTPDCTLQVALAPDVYYEVDPKLRRCVQLRVATALVFLCLLLGAATAIAIVVFRVRRVYEDAHGKGLVVALGVQCRSLRLLLLRRPLHCLTPARLASQSPPPCWPSSSPPTGARRWR
jgi:hypothetical protein